MPNLSRKSEAGFTLVELAIVMIIIGLLIGGILKGQELIANAQIKATISQIQALQSAITTFRDKYSAMPGDMTNPTTRLPNCTAAPCSAAGNGNGRVEIPGLGSVPTNSQEGAVAFSQLAASGLITGVEAGSSIIAFGQMLPEAKIGGGFWLGYTATGNASGGLTGLRTGHYLVFNGSVQNVGSVTGSLNPNQAAQIDRALDDGNPATGDIRVAGTNCISASLYNEGDESALCALYIRIQQ